MGSSCSSGQAHKDKDTSSQRSEESPSYQITCKNKPLDQEVKSTSSLKTGVVLEPTMVEAAVLPQPTLYNSTTPLTSNKITPKSFRSIATSSYSTDSVSPNSPPGVTSPREVDKSKLPALVHKLPENSQHLLLGAIAAAKTTTRFRKIVIYVCAADSQDCCIEKGLLHNKIYPSLREKSVKRGYELHIVDLHWKTGLEKQQDHEFPELCLGELARQSDTAYVIPVLFLSNSLGTPLLPKTIETQDFEIALSEADNKELLTKWYQLDSHAQPPCYRLQPIASHIPGFKEQCVEEKEKALAVWSSEIERILSVMLAAFPQELRDSYLTTVVEQEVHNTVLMSQEMALRCLWLCRVFTHQSDDSKSPLSPSDIELKRRLDTLQKGLKSQLRDQHIMRLTVKWQEGGGVDTHNSEHAQYVADVTANLTNKLTAIIDGIIDEDQNKTVIKSSQGIESELLQELLIQTNFIQRSANCSVNREVILSEIKSYVIGEKSVGKIMVLHGVDGCGKTTLLAKVAQCCHSWLPDCAVVVRVANISPQSSTTEELLRTVIVQCSIIATGNQVWLKHKPPRKANEQSEFSLLYHTRIIEAAGQGELCVYSPYIIQDEFLMTALTLPVLPIQRNKKNLEIYSENLLPILAAVSLQRTIIIIIDGIDQVQDYGTIGCDWLLMSLPENAKIILSVGHSSALLKKIQTKLGNSGVFIQIPELDKSEAESILLSSVMEYNHSVNSNIQECVVSSVKACTLPLYVKILAWQTSWLRETEQNIEPQGDVVKQLSVMLCQLEETLGKEQVSLTMALLTSAKYGLTDSEMLDLLAFEKIFHSEDTYVTWAPACLFWARFNKQMSPFLQWIPVKNTCTLQWKTITVRSIIQQRYQESLKVGHEKLMQYFKGKTWQNVGDGFQARYVLQDSNFGKSYNCRKLEELPFQEFFTTGSLWKYLEDHTWVCSKICGGSVYQVLEDIKLEENSGKYNESLHWLRHFFEENGRALAYDGRQLYSLLHSVSSNVNPFTKWKDVIRNPPILSLIPLAKEDINGEVNISGTQHCLDMIIRLPKNPNFVVTIATDTEEISVWDIQRCSRVRTLKGVTQPINLHMVDDFRCVVLCKRELRTYNLNTGTLLTKLKGVMNQKMPYFGLHDANHLVALSRNRMYVNLMNLDSGDLVTTFKAGEDRFLNSLLVSGDGRVLVCGDETQKPFPLLVWNLASRKLLYDLRIPHHDFITSLAAITYEGHYVCCVAKEVDEPSPNFIVVYDLQSGTMFKKWKPSVDTVSLDISSKDGCVLSGLVDGCILVWDLITGNCRWKLSGHTAPVTSLHLDPLGGCFLSLDAECRDRSLRLWNLVTGEQSAVFTPKLPITACEVTAGGKMVVLAMQGSFTLTTLHLGPKQDRDESPPVYGLKENTGLTFNLEER